MRTIVLIISVAAVMVGCSHIAQKEGTQASAPAASTSPSTGRAVASPDISEVGPGGHVTIFFRDGDHVVVRTCGDYNVIKTRQDCVGKENRVPVQAFKNVLKSLITIDRADSLKPLTKEEIKTYRQGKPENIEALRQREKNLDAKLTKITSFIQAYGADDVSTKEKSDIGGALTQVKAELRTKGSQEKMVQKVNALIDRIVNDLLKPGEMNSYSYATAKDQAVYTVLQNFDPNTKYPCGGSGSVMQRIGDCATQKVAKGVPWNLVIRTDTGHEVWRDGKSAKIWSDKFDRTYSQYEAGQACISSETLDARGRVVALNWGLPSKEDYQEAESHGIREALPNMNHWFWSSSVYSAGSVYACYFSGDDGYLDSYYRKVPRFGSVRRSLGVVRSNLMI